MSGSGMSATGASSNTVQQAFGRYGMKRNLFSTVPVSTGYSSARQGEVIIDPSIRAIQDQGLVRINDLYGQTGAYGDELIGNTRTLRNRFLGNQSDYANAMLNPLREQVAQRRGELARSTSIRGLSGSSFGEQAMTNFDIASQRALQDAGAKVEMEQLQALTGIDANLASQMFGKISSQAALNGESLDIAKSRLSQELSALGIGLQQIGIMTNAFESYQNRMLRNLHNVSHTDAVSVSYSGMGGGKGGGGSG